MNEEVEVEVIEKLINRCNECKFATCENCEINWVEVQAIGKMLERYKYLEEIEETEKMGGPDILYLRGYIDGKKTYKDKIRAIMEDLNNKIKKAEEIEAILMIKQQQILQKVLEE